MFHQSVNINNLYKSHHPNETVTVVVTSKPVLYQFLSFVRPEGGKLQGDSDVQAPKCLNIFNIGWNNKGKWENGPQSNDNGCMMFQYVSCCKYDAHIIDLSYIINRPMNPWGIAFVVILAIRSRQKMLDVSQVQPFLPRGELCYMHLDEDHHDTWHLNGNIRQALSITLSCGCQHHCSRQFRWRDQFGTLTRVISKVEGAIGLE